MLTALLLAATLVTPPMCPGADRGLGETAASSPRPAPGRCTLDTFTDTTPWIILHSDGIAATLAPEKGALRLNVDFAGRAGYAAARRPLPVDWPDNFELGFRLKGSGPANDLQLKLTDAGGDNVWWWVRPAETLPGDWRTIRIKRRQTSFAWGPTPDKTLRHTAALELVLGASDGGKASISIDDLTLTPLPPADTPYPAPVVTASSGSDAKAILDTDPATLWRSAATGPQSLTLDFGRPREFGGLILHWATDAPAIAYDIQLSDDGKAWRTIRRVTGSDGGEDPLRLPESEARWLRLALGSGPAKTYALAGLDIKDIAFGATPNAFVTALAKDAIRGSYPRGFSEQSYWTLVGADGAADSALIGEDGAVELGKGGPSLEPVLIDGSHRLGWADARVTQSLAKNYLPIPTVRWTTDALTLDTTAFAAGTADQSQLVTRYTIRNTGPTRRNITFALALRPYQVNGPRQFLAVTGGVSPIERIAWNGRALTVAGRIVATPLQAPTRAGTAAFDAGSLPARLSTTGWDADKATTDPTGLASAAMAWDLDLAPGAARTIDVAAPLTGTPPPPADAARAQAETAASWDAKLGRFHIETPAAGQVLVDTARSSLAHILMSRTGPSLRPGTRSYARSWIRDGAMMAESLLRLGHGAIAADYLRWYAPYQFDNGKIPCCVDARGSDPVPENDSHGQFAFLAAEVWRYGRDRTLALAMWPHVERALAWQDALRLSERTPANLTPARRAYYGLMPPSISHEGYSDKAAYSYWDDDWALEGYGSGIALARALGQDAALARLTGQAAQFRSDLAASVLAATKWHGIDYIPGAADRGDFDATSTTVGLSPGDGARDLPPALLRATFDRQWQRIVDRRDGRLPFADYTPYEIRNVGAFLRLGQRERAMEAMAFYLDDRRPPAWNGWAEVVGKQPREPRFIGDMPHAWISSDYLRTALDLFYYEQDAALVLAAGIPAAWLRSAGIAVTGVRTPFGTLDYSLRPRGKALILTLGGTARPDAGFVLPWPFAGVPGPAQVDGRPVAFLDGELAIPAGTKTVTLSLP